MMSLAQYTDYTRTDVEIIDEKRAIGFHGQRSMFVIKLPRYKQTHRNIYTYANRFVIIHA